MLTGQILTVYIILLLNIIKTIIYLIIHNNECAIDISNQWHSFNVMAIGLHFLMPNGLKMKTLVKTQSHAQ